MSESSKLESSLSTNRLKGETTVAVGVIKNWTLEERIKALSEGVSFFHVCRSLESYFSYNNSTKEKRAKVLKTLLHDCAPIILDAFQKNKTARKEQIYFLCQALLVRNPELVELFGVAICEIPEYQHLDALKMLLSLLGGVSTEEGIHMYIHVLSFFMEKENIHESTMLMVRHGGSEVITYLLEAIERTPKKDLVSLLIKVVRRNH